MNLVPRIAAVLGIAGAVLMASAPRAAAVGWTTAQVASIAQSCWAVGNALWLVYGLRTAQAALAAQYGAFLAISFWGLINWGAA